MSEHAASGVATSASQSPSNIVKGRLFRRYAVFFIGVVCVSLLANGVFGIWYSYREHEASLVRIQREQAVAAAAKIDQFIAGVESQLGWTVQLPWSAQTMEQRRFDAQRLLRQVSAITELAQVDADGREQLHVSRLAMDVMGRGKDLSGEAKFIEARQHRVYYGPVYFHRGSEPYMTLALAGALREAGVSIAELNLKLIWDVVSQIKVGEHGRAYVVDAQGRLIAHPDIGLVLRNTDLSHLDQVRRARAAEGGISPRQIHTSFDADGQPVLPAFAPISRLGWQVMIELPLEEAYAPVYASLLAIGLLLLGGLVVAIVASVVLARKMVMPIQALQRSAERIGGGMLDHRIDIASGDELEALGNQFNNMAGRLQESYATLEHKVEERTHQLDLANQAKSRFLAAASHDLRQPMHALNLYLGALAAYDLPEPARPVLANVRHCAQTMDEMFRALLDISRLDASVVETSIEVFAIASLLDRIRMEFAPQAQAKGLVLRVAPCSAFVRSDPALLGRVLSNLVSNAVRYTVRGKILIGCRRTPQGLRLAIYDTGPGIASDQQRAVFEEFYQVDNPGRDRAQGLGLGLAIVQRLANLLDARLTLRSEAGRGSCFAIELPVAHDGGAAPGHRLLAPAAAGVDLTGALVVVVEDEQTILDATRALLEQWGCTVIAAVSGADAIAQASTGARVPDAIVCDYRLRGDEIGIDVIAQLRGEFNCDIPALLITGDTAPDRIQAIQASGLPVLHKPLQENVLRKALSQLLDTNSLRKD